MQKPNKSQLRHPLTDGISNQNLQETDETAVDEGALIQDEMYKQTVLRYVKYVNRYYGKCSIVFNEYKTKLTIKDYEHQR